MSFNSYYKNSKAKNIVIEMRNIFIDPQNGEFIGFGFDEEYLAAKYIGKI